MQHVPILCIDVQGFTTHPLETQRTLLRRLQAMATDAAHFFMPYGDVWAKWQRHGTGDGYYFVFDALSPQVALLYALNLDAALSAHNAQHGADLPIRLYAVLVLGDVERVDDQYLSAAFSEAARFLSHEPLKKYLRHQPQPMVLAMSALFHTEWQADIACENLFPETTDLQWTRFTCHDKHDYAHHGYVRGPGWDAPRPAAEPGPPEADAYRRYYQRCQEAWSQARYALDTRFVHLTLLLDQGEDAQGPRWQPARETFHDLAEVLAYVPDQAVVLLGPPGAGKSTLLRHHELTCANAALTHTADDLSAAPLTFFVALNDYRPAEGSSSLPAPLEWLAARWATACPELPGLLELLRARRLTLLLDALNEMPMAGAEAVQPWKAFLRSLARDYPGTRVVFSCRALEYSVPLSSKDLPVPQVRIEELSDAQVEAFLGRYSPEHGATLWRNLQGTPQLEALRLPYYLRLLVEHSRHGEIPAGRAALFTAFVRQAVQREVLGDNPLFQPGALLHARDVARLADRDWAPCDLPERGPLFPRLSALAYAMQSRRAAHEAGQVRVAYDVALQMLDHPQAEAILQAGEALGVLDERRGQDQVLYRHQLLQEYCAARHLAQESQPELVHQEWHVERVQPGLQETLRTLADSDPLPPLPGTGWEETMLLAVAMSRDPARLVTALRTYNLPLAGRCAAQPDVVLPEALKDEVRWALVARTQEASADLRARIAAGLALGELGDPRFELRQGPHGAYLLPPMVEIPGGTYRIGSDEGLYADEAPEHEVTLAPFALGQFPVTNAEWALFMRAGGYDDERWWDTAEAQAWRRGENTAAGAQEQWRENRKWFQENVAQIRQLHREQRITSQQADDWEAIAEMSDAAFEALLAEWYPPGRQTQPAYWHDGAFNHPAQPVVGICWFEARAYCAWLSAQSGASFRLPTEAEWEAAARGAQGWCYAYGPAFDATCCNTFETHIRRTTPIGAFPGGVTPTGLVDMMGNTWDWTSSVFQPYPYDATDGCEILSSNMARRVVRGGSWADGHPRARASFRDRYAPGGRGGDVGLRVVRVVPSS